jgi:hypothetical protein
MQQTIQIEDRTYTLVCNFGVMKDLWQRYKLPHFSALLERIDLLFPEQEQATKEGQRKNPQEWTADDWDFMAAFIFLMIQEGARIHGTEVLPQEEVENTFFPYRHNWFAKLGACFFGFLGTMASDGESTGKDVKKKTP